jgi:hypothetical protein
MLIHFDQTSAPNTHDHTDYMYLHIINIIFEVLSMPRIHTVDFWVIMPCSLVKELSTHQTTRFHSLEAHNKNIMGANVASIAHTHTHTVQAEFGARGVSHGVQLPAPLFLKVMWGLHTLAAPHCKHSTALLWARDTFNALWLLLRKFLNEQINVKYLISPLKYQVFHNVL